MNGTMATKQRILIFSGGLDIGGVEKSLLSLLQAMDKRKYDVELMLVKADGVWMKYVPTSIALTHFPARYSWLLIPRGHVLQSLRRSIGFNLNAPRFVYYLVKGLLTKKMGQSRQQLFAAAKHTLESFPGYYDVAIDYTGNFKALVLHKVNARKKISWVHGDYRVLERDFRIDQQDYSQMDAIVTVSATCKNFFLEVFPQLCDKCHVMYNLVFKDSITTLTTENVNFGPDFKGTKIVDVTRLDPDKGIELAIEACGFLKAEGRLVRWYIIGEGPERQRLEKLIEERGLKSDFILLGKKENPYPYIKQADIIVHCSRFEGKSVTIDEAMVLQKPIILTDYSTAKDQITSGENGLICPLDPLSIAQAVTKLLDDPAQRQRYSDALRDHDTGVRQALACFDALMNESAPGGHEQRI